jgi:regulator of sigma E protease
MNIIIFIIILGLLVFIHELGHFLFAKYFGVRVDEFGFGYPPKALTLGTWRGTDITLNWIPFGGFVRLFGETEDDEQLSDEDKAVSLVHKPRWQQFLVMFGGILFNIILGWVLLSGTYMAGIQAPVDSAPQNYTFASTELSVTSVMPESPAFEAGLQPGDVILEYGSVDQNIVVVNEDISDLSQFVDDTGAKENELYIIVERANTIEEVSIRPEEGVVAEGFGIGIGAQRTGEMKLPFFQALWYGAKNTFFFIGAIVIGLIDLFTGSLSLDAVSGPVGIVGQVGDAASIGFSYLLGFTAILSLNLAVLNALPFPALDGGRIAIIAIESLTRKKIPQQVVQWINGIGFLILIGLMILITVNDVIRLF